MKIIFWSESGNTEAMAELIKKGIESEGKTAELVQVSSISAEEAAKEEILILGCPARGAENLEEDEMEPFVSSLEGKVEGKKVALFGSYDWGNGEWMDEWELRMKSYGATLVSEGLKVNLEPENDDECIEFGKLIARQ